MANITNRDDFTKYCLRRLGAPVIQINVDNDQIQDRIDDALQYFVNRHADGTQKVYWIHKITQDDINNKFLDASLAKDSNNNSLEIVGISRIFPLTDSQSNVNMFDLRYQLRLNELYDFSSASYINYTLTQQHLRSLEIMFTGEVPIRFNRYMQKLFIDWGWGTEANIGDTVIAEAYATINPDVYNWIWNDPWIKEYATALIKRDWGNNMKKFGNLQLPGGVILNGKETYEEAITEIEKLETEIENLWGAPLEFFMN
jgi:hypothetical protein